MANKCIRSSSSSSKQQEQTAAQQQQQQQVFFFAFVSMPFCRLCLRLIGPGNQMERMCQ
jgi:hypothetical protein